GPATDGSPAANAIRPAGYHNDYTVASRTAGAPHRPGDPTPRHRGGGGALGLGARRTEAVAATVALRADQTNYDYDNRMRNGNTDQNGVPCGANGCLYARPADRDDRFDNVSPRATVSWQPSSHSFLYMNASTGFRPPEMTELYRLQRQQSTADLDS